MTEVSNTYQPKVGIEQGGDRMFMKELGEFKFFDTDYTGVTLRNFLRSHYTLTVQSISNVSLWSGPVGSAVPLFTPCYGHHLLAFDAGCSKVSCCLLSGSKGDILWVDGFGMASDASIQLTFSVTANLASAFTQRGSRISTIYMKRTGLSAGTASIGAPFLQMICTEDSKWSVVSASEGVIVQGE